MTIPPRPSTGFIQHHNLQQTLGGLLLYHCNLDQLERVLVLLVLLKAACLSKETVHPNVVYVFYKIETFPLSIFFFFSGRGYKM